ncbi:hypothetical protein AAMO2058_001725700 [Amorphochlora amoebiformis]
MAPRFLAALASLALALSVLLWRQGVSHSLSANISSSTRASTKTLPHACGRRKAMHNSAGALLSLVGTSQVNSAHGRSSPLPGQPKKLSLARTKIPREDFTEGPQGLLFFDLESGGGTPAKNGERVAIHYSLKWKGITIATSRQGAGVTGGSPYGFDVGQNPGDPGSAFIKGLDLAVVGMQVGGVRRVIVPPELAYGNRQVQEISPNSEVILDIELLSVARNSIPGLNKSVRI